VKYKIHRTVKKEKKENYTSISAIHRTVLLHDTEHWFTNKIRALETIVSALGRDKCVKIPVIVSRLANSIF